MNNDKNQDKLYLNPFHPKNRYLPKEQSEINQESQERPPVQFRNYFVRKTAWAVREAIISLLQTDFLEEDIEKAKEAIRPYVEEIQLPIDSVFTYILAHGTGRKSPDRANATTQARSMKAYVMIVKELLEIKKRLEEKDLGQSFTVLKDQVSELM